MKKRKDEKEEKTISSSKNSLIEMNLNLKYEFRYNTIKQCCEFMEFDESRMEPTKTDWQQMTKLKLNSIKRELDANNIQTNTGNIREILESSYSPPVNPVEAYFSTLPPYDHKDYIAELCNTVECKNNLMWQDYFTKWLVSSVANVFVKKKCTNHTCLVLTGGQGKYKTTWLNLLCPPSLSPAYIYTGKPNIEDTRKMNQLISENFIINLDDTLRKINIKDENELKNYITLDYAKYDRKFDPYINEYPRLANFIGSVNGNDFLTDPTGSRRFLAFEVLNINIQEALKIDMDKVYSQALHLFQSGMQYWIDQTEIAELEANNAEFQVSAIEEELLQQFFTKPEKWETAEKYITKSKIFIDLEAKSGNRKLSIKRLNDALTKLNFEMRQIRLKDGSRKRVYAVNELLNSDLYDSQGSDYEEETTTPLRKQGNIF